MPSVFLVGKWIISGTIHSKRKYWHQLAPILATKSNYYSNPQKYVTSHVLFPARNESCSRQQESRESLNRKFWLKLQLIDLVWIPYSTWPIWSRNFLNRHSHHEARSLTEEESFEFFNTEVKQQLNNCEIENWNNGRETGASQICGEVKRDIWNPIKMPVNQMPLVRGIFW